MTWGQGGLLLRVGDGGRGFRYRIFFHPMKIAEVLEKGVSRYILSRDRILGRVATKISRNEIPWNFVLFLFRIFAKILGKFRGMRHKT